ncbi:MAG: hypothetical protein NT120_02350 [Candidatus Aenigmarchaeota archaeon]|nr:hypothetical protein [Candidatus Aenigmarchaeota archaeon]
MMDVKVNVWMVFGILLVIIIFLFLWGVGTGLINTANLNLEKTPISGGAVAGLAMNKDKLRKAIK